MYGRGNFPPPYQHPSRLPPPNQMRPTGTQGSLTAPYPVPTSHSYSIPNTNQQYSQTLPQQILPPPPRLPFPPHQTLYQSMSNSSPNFAPVPPHSQFGTLGTNSTISTAAPMQTLPPPPPSLPPPAMPPPPTLPPPAMPPPPTLPPPAMPPPPSLSPPAMPPPPSLPPPAMPPPPSLSPPAMPPPPPEETPKLDDEEAVADTEKLDSTSSTILETKKAGSISPSLSDMDMEGI